MYPNFVFMVEYSLLHIIFVKFIFYLLEGQWIGSTFWLLWIMFFTAALAYKILFVSLYSIYLVNISRSGITGSNGNPMFSFWRTNLFHSGYTSLLSYQSCMRILISPHPLWHLFFSILLWLLLLILLLLPSSRYKVILLYGFALYFPNANYICMCLLGICLPSLEKYLSSLQSIFNCF